LNVSRYAKSAFEQDHLLHPMGLFVEDLGESLDTAQFVAALTDVLTAYGNKIEPKDKIVAVVPRLPTFETLTGPPTVPFQLIGQDVFKKPAS
jgi:hypothetical protein